MKTSNRARQKSKAATKSRQPEKLSQTKGNKRGTAKVPTQTEKQAEKSAPKANLRHGEYVRGRSVEIFIATSAKKHEMDMASIMVEGFIQKQFATKWDDACSELETLLHAIRHNPNLSYVISALKKVERSSCVLAKFANTAGLVKKYRGFESGYSPEEWQALQWFSGYFEDLRDGLFADVIVELWGFYGWIKDQTTFREIAAAIDDLLNADCELRMFIKKGEER